ncbi:MAG: GNAT family N-acetyltransferase [Defluviitaleaceae bacterium]|nr:GNAT family N-acetyltransferase [Defluviitaleaceae bacterium]
MIVKLSKDDGNRLAPLIAKFRAELKSYKGITAAEDIDAAQEEADEFLTAGFPIYIYEEDGKYVGYIVCKEDGAVWVEQLYVLPNHRGKGIAGALYAAAEELAGGDTLYNWVHPNNDAMIRFLAKRGYSTLNLIEIRKPYQDEISREKICVKNNEFDY